jgi:biotin carboxyl carrier protein
VTDRPSFPDAGPAGALDRLADEILPALIARLDSSDLGELEVRHGGWRVRLRRDLTPAPAPAQAHGSAVSSAGASSSSAPDTARTGATSPAVGYFIPNERTGVGKKVASGDTLGWVEVLGVRQEVVAPRDGTVGRFLAEPGQAVEYGQELVVVDGPRRAGEPSEAADAPGETA